MPLLQALSKYKQIHTDFPANVECLRYLMHICSEQGNVYTMTTRVCMT